MLVPVPLDPGRERQRGYNQAALLARPLAGALRLPCAPGLLRRAGASTLPQVGLSRARRRENVRDAFLAHPDVSGREVLLVDDVTTTGSTLGSAAGACRAPAPSGSPRSPSPASSNKQVRRAGSGGPRAQRGGARRGGSLRKTNPPRGGVASFTVWWPSGAMLELTMNVIDQARSVVQGPEALEGRVTLTLDLDQPEHRAALGRPGRLARPGR